MPNLTEICVIAALDTHQGFATGFFDKPMSDELKKEKQAEGLDVRNKLFPPLTKDHESYALWVAARPHVEAVFKPRNLRNKARAFHNSITHPTRVRGEGMLVESLQVFYDQTLVALSGDTEAAKPQAKASLPHAIAYAQAVKNGSFVASKYPTEADIDACGFEWRYKPVADSDSRALQKMINKLGSERAEQLREQIKGEEKAQLLNAVRASIQGTTGALNELVKMLANPDKKVDGKRTGTRLERALDRVAIAKAQLHDFLADPALDNEFDQIAGYLSAIDLGKLAKTTAERVSAVNQIKNLAGALGSRKFNL